MIDTILLIAALIAFLLATFEVEARIDFMPLGFAFLVATLLTP